MAEHAPTYVGRLAPSPTGFLHLGHASTFWTAFQRAQQASGTLWLRDEDLDPQRSRADFATAMREDLQWLGISWNAEMRQSERLPFYHRAMVQILAAGLAYQCTCSRKDLQAATQAPHDEETAEPLADLADEPIYNGHCRNNTHPTFDPNSNYRLRVPDAELITFTDLNAGPQSFRAGCNATADFGDFLIWRKDGLPSYQLACAVDDAAMGITEVVRGRDLLKSTARQTLLQRALNYPTPNYFHCDLMRDESGIRLAKRNDALSLKALRESGVTPDQIRARFYQSP